MVDPCMANLDIYPAVPRVLVSREGAAGVG